MDKITEKLPEAITDQINSEADLYGFVVPYDGSNTFYIEDKVKGYQAGATAWAPWKVKYDELTAQLKHKDFCIEQLQQLVEADKVHYRKLMGCCEKMEKDITHLMNVFKMITKMPVPATEKEYMSWFVYVKNISGGAISEWEAEKEVQQWKDGKGKEAESFTQFALECAITAIPLSVLNSDGEYFKAGDGKRFVAFRWDKDENNARISIREDGDTRFVFNGVVTSVEDFKKAWQLTILL